MACCDSKYVCRECWEIGINPVYHSETGCGCGHTSSIITDRMRTNDCCQAGHTWINPIHVVFIDGRWRDIRSLDSCVNRKNRNTFILKQCDWTYSKKKCFCCQYKNTCTFAHSEHELNYWKDELIYPTEIIIKNIYDRLPSSVIEELKVLCKIRNDIKIEDIDENLIRKINSIPVSETIIKIKCMSKMQNIKDPIKKLMYMITEPLYKFEKVRSIPRVFNNIGFVSEDIILTNNYLRNVVPYHLVSNYEYAITPKYPVYKNMCI